MKNCLWDDPKALREQAAKLRSIGFLDSAEGCLVRATKVERLLPSVEKHPKLSRLLEEPVDGL